MTEKLNSKIIIGRMSGTSVDGIDACIVKITPDETENNEKYNKFSFKIIESFALNYPENIRQNIFKIFQSKISAEEICWMNFVLGEYFAQAAIEVIKKAGMQPQHIDLIESHGQTIFHKPADEYINGFNKKSTLQIGEASIIAERTGITTISDFRTADIAAGGQGAPLVCFADEILFKDCKVKRAIQNIGGMANVTVVTHDMETFAFDTGPGNVMIDYCAKKYFNHNYDKDGLFASQGEIDENWLNYLLDEKYYTQTPPKTTGRELFSPKYIEEMLLNAPQNPYNIMKTITALTAKSIFNAYEQFIFPKTSIDELILGGGGAYNSELIKLMKEYFKDSLKILRHDDFGIPDKSKEAMAFALLAYTTYYKIPNNIPSCTGATHKKILGKISHA